MLQASHVPCMCFSLHVFFSVFFCSFTSCSLPLCPPAVAELEASRSGDARIRRLFVDPLGQHALLTLQTGGGAGAMDTYYVDGGLKRARLLPKLRGLALTSVAWSPVLRASSFG